MTESEKVYHRIAASLTGARESSMFGAACIKAANGKAVAMLWKGDMVFKLRDKEQEEALNLAGAKMFTPMEGRPMNGWVQVPVKHAARWPALAEASMRIVSALEAKPRKGSAGKK